MIELLILTRAPIIALLVLSIWYTFQEGEIFGFVSYYGDRLPDKLQQPIFACNVCMTFWWGSLLYWGLHLLRFWDGVGWKTWLVTVIVAMGINATINKLAPPDATEEKPLIIENKDGK
jgi:hypothetical protein